MNPAEQYILQQPEPARSILLHLQVIIESTLRDAIMLYKFKLPFYYINGKLPFCYLNHTKGYVDLCFWHGAHLTVHTEKLVSKGRKHMKSLRYYSPEDVDKQVLVDILSEAYSVRDRKYYK
tara:strand:- start:67308 stop:67670 length:363 start_codon:yes stop_codon:yes gene_type:complete